MNLDFIKKINEKKHKQIDDFKTEKSNIINDNTVFGVIEAYKATRTNILFALSGTSPEQGTCKKVVFTSAEPGEGKTTSVINMAITFAQTGARVLLIDCDLRKPRIHRYLDVRRIPGVSEMLIGMAQAKDCIRHVSQHHIDCITAGQIPPNPVELLSSSLMEGLLQSVEGQYDYILIDTPPVTVVTDAAVLAKFVDGVVVVVRQDYTIHELLQKARETLIFANAKILGYVMNDVKKQPGIGYAQYGGAYKRNSYKYKYNYTYGDKV